MDKFSLEKVKKSKINLGSFLNEKFLSNIKSLNLQPINMTFIKHTDEMKLKNIPPQILIVSHENDKEIEENLVHITCLDDKLLKDFIDRI